MHTKHSLLQRFPCANAASIFHKDYCGNVQKRKYLGHACSCCMASRCRIYTFPEKGFLTQQNLEQKVCTFWTTENPKIKFVTAKREQNKTVQFTHSSLYSDMCGGIRCKQLSSNYNPITKYWENKHLLRSRVGDIAKYLPLKLKNSLLRNLILICLQVNPNICVWGKLGAHTML